MDSGLSLGAAIGSIAEPTRSQHRGGAVTPTDKAASLQAPEESRSPSNTTQITDAEQQQVQDLARRDRQVRAHETAHSNTAGRYARGGASYSYERGPDGRLYATGGEVKIDTAPISGDPQATIEKARVIRAAALAPAQPSSQDRVVANQATQMAAQARAELTGQQQEVRSEKPELAATGYASNQGNRQVHSTFQAGSVVNLFA
ncbi:MAG: hypothetical protein GXP09_06210 [Gammaproteobacteria bacterium]|nr:hypothetical protein [Gammaproteobacteria bacterium]